MDDQLSYFSADGVSKCKLFALTLVGLVWLWLNVFLNECIDSWMEFCKIFSTEFTARKQRPIIEAALRGIMLELYVAYIMKLLVYKEILLTSRAKLSLSPQERLMIKSLMKDISCAS